MKSIFKSKINTLYAMLAIFTVGFLVLGNFNAQISNSGMDLKSDGRVFRIPDDQISTGTRSLSRSEDWCKFRGDLNNTGYSTSKAPNVLNTLWHRNFNTIDLPDPLYSSPTIVGDMVYIGCTDRSIYALDKYTGNTVWSQTTVNLGGKFSGDEILSSAAVANGILYFGCSDRNIFALNADTGDYLWNFTTNDEIRASPAVSDNKVIIGSYEQDRTVYALNALSGSVEWKFQTGYAIHSTAAIVDGVVFIGTDSDAGANDSCVFALDLDTGTELWNFTTATGKGVHSSVAVGGDKVFFGSVDRNVYALNRTTGAEVWHFTTGDIVKSSPALDMEKGILYIGSNDNKLYALPMDDPNSDGKLNTSEIFWSYQTNGKIQHSSPVIADGKIFIGSYDRNFYALDASPEPMSQEKREVWDEPLWTDGFIDSSAAVSDGIIFITSESGTIWALASTDLAIYEHEVRISDLHPFEGETVEIETTVVNNGTIELTGNLGFFDWAQSGSSRLLKKYLINESKFTLDAGEYLTLKTQWVAVAGDHHIVVQVNETEPEDSYTDNNLAAWILDPISGVYTKGWSMFQNDTAHTGMGWRAPRTNKTEWAFTTGGAIKSSAAIAKGRIFFTSLNGKIYAVNENDGSEIWNYSVGESIYTSPAFIASGGEDTSYDKIFIGAEDGKIYAFNMNDGTLLWSFQTGGAVRSSPIVINGTVFVGSTDGRFYALDEDGQTDGDQGIADAGTTSADLLWNKTVGLIRAASPAASSEDNKIYLAIEAGKFFTLNRSNGDTLWEHNFGTSAIIASSPTLGTDLVYIGTYDNKFYALNTNDGEVSWSAATGGAIGCSAALDTVNNIVIVGSDDGKIYAYDALTGENLWSYQTGGAVRSSPAIADGKVFFGSEDGNIYSLSEFGNYGNTTQLYWSFQTGDKIHSSPTIANNGLYIGSDSGILFRLGSPNVPPISRITSPENRSVYFTDENITFDASLSHDLEDLKLLYNWTSKSTLQLPGELPKTVITPIYEGYEQKINRTLPDGDHLIILSVKDSMGGISNATTNITVHQPRTEYFLNSTIPADCTIYYGGKGTVEIIKTTNPGSITTGNIGLFTKYRFEPLTSRYKLGWANITVSIKNANVPEGLNISRLNIYSWDVVNRNWVKYPNSGVIDLGSDDIRVWAQGDDLVSTQIMVYSPGIFDNSPPELEIVNDAVYPQEGSDYETFTFRVKYTDLNNDAPIPANGGNIWVYINGKPHQMSESDSNDTDFTNGKEYQLQLTGTEIGIGTNNTFYFTAHDGTYQAIGDTGTQTGPVITRGTPVADAGEDIWVDVDKVFQLDGSGSYDNDGTIITYYWDIDAEVDADGNGIYDDDQERTGETATWKYTETGKYTVTLTVVDDSGASSKDTVTVTVREKTDSDVTFKSAEWVYYSIIIVIIIIIILAIVLLVLRGRMKEEEEFKKFKAKDKDKDEVEEEDEGEEEEEEEYECPSCGAILTEEDNVCPECGEEFEDEDDDDDDEE